MWKIFITTGLACLLWGCTAAQHPAPATVGQISAAVGSVAGLTCGQLSSADKAAAVPILTQAHQLGQTNLPALIAMLEAITPGTGGALGQVWSAVHVVLDSVGWVTAYQPAALAAIDGCLAAVQPVAA